MAITNPFSITYAGLAVGGSSSYQLLGPYVIDKSHERLRLVFDVLVVATSYATLQSLSETLEAGFSKRMTAGQTLLITLSGSSWTYTMGSTLLKAASTITKTGNPDTDLGYSRAYTCSIDAELPATATSGLRDVEVIVSFTSSRQKIVTMRGTYTATAAGSATARYLAAFDTEAATYLSAIDSTATFELVDENYSMDREKTAGGTPGAHTCNFFRQYTELLANQSQGSVDAAGIRDHRIVFTDLSQYPGDSGTTSRLHRVIGSYDCAVDIDVSTDLQTVYSGTIVDHVKALFREYFQPDVFCVENMRASYDETNKRVSVSMEFLYLTNSSGVIEASQSVAYREIRTIDYTPTHDKYELTAEVDPGFGILERVWTRVAIVNGLFSPSLRIFQGAGNERNLPFADISGGSNGPNRTPGKKISKDGWNIISSTSNVEQKVIGSPDHEQIYVSVLTDSVIERYNQQPSKAAPSISTPIMGGSAKPGGPSS